MELRSRNWVQRVKGLRGARLQGLQDIDSRFPRGTKCGLWSGTSNKMSVTKIQVGQVWKKVDTDETFLVTRLYNEALATIAVLRPAGKETSAILRIKVERNGGGQTIPGYTMAQDSDAF